MMEFKNCLIKSVIIFGIGLCLFPVITESRQMCWTCQFVQNGPGTECMTEPANWTMGDPRINCSTTRSNTTKCIIAAEFDAATGAPTFLYRGCGQSTQKDGCDDNGVSHTCFFSCENNDYCNDKSLPVSPIMENNTDGEGGLADPGPSSTLCFECYSMNETNSACPAAGPVTDFQAVSNSTCSDPCYTMTDPSGTMVFRGCSTYLFPKPLPEDGCYDWEGTTICICRRVFCNAQAIGQSSGTELFPQDPGPSSSLCFECTSLPGQTNPACPVAGPITDFQAVSNSTCSGPCYTMTDPFGSMVFRGCSTQLFQSQSLPEDGCYDWEGTTICICRRVFCNAQAIGQSSGTELFSQGPTTPPPPTTSPPTTTTCGGTLTGTKGQIQSLNFPNPYPDNSLSECYYHIEVPVTSTVLLTVTSFRLEDDADCNFYYIMMYDGTSTSAPILDSRRCGARSPFEVQSTGNTMLVQIFFDSSLNYSGFHANFTAVDGEVDGVMQCYQCVNYDQRWNYYPQCPKDSRVTNAFNSNCTGKCFTRSYDYDDRLVARGCTADQPGLPSPLPEDGCYTYYGSVWCICSTSGCNSAALGRSTGVELNAHITTGPTTQRITPTTTPCGGIYTGTEGQIQSPNFPNPYPDNSECYYHIEVPATSTVLLIFTSFHLEDDADCNFEYIAMYDGTSTSAPILGSRRCGARRPFVVQSTGNTMLVEFVTDGSVSYSGFNATFTAVEGGLTTQRITTTTTTTSCGGTYTGTEGQIQSPNFPNPYPDNSECYYHIEVPATSSVLLTFSSFGLENDADCAFDYIEIYAGTSMLGSRRCGASSPFKVQSTGNTMLVKFVTDGSVSFYGFNATFTAVEGGKPMDGHIVGGAASSVDVKELYGLLSFSLKLRLAP